MIGEMGSVKIAVCGDSKINDHKPSMDGMSCYQSFEELSQANFWTLDSYIVHITNQFHQ